MCIRDRLGITLASLAIGWLGEPAVSAVLEAPLLSWGFPEATVYPICVAVEMCIRDSLGDVVGALRLPEVHPLLDFEILDLHGGSPSR